MRYDDLQHMIQIITSKIQQFTYEGYILVFVPGGGKLLIDKIEMDLKSSLFPSSILSVSRDNFLTHIVF